jgi:hypothetical protein
MFKAIIITALMFFYHGAAAQDLEKTRTIDSLVQLINQSAFNIERDTIKADYPDMGLSSTTYLTMVRHGAEVKKYVNNFHTSMKENGRTKETIGENAFYFNSNKLIKVEEFIIQDGRKLEMSWYYADDKPVYYTLQSEKSQERAQTLLTLANAILEKVKL